MGGCVLLFQLLKLLLNVYAGEQGLAPVNLSACGQLAEPAGFVGGEFAGNAKLLKELRRGVGKVRLKEYANYAEAFRKVVHDGGQPVLFGLVLCQYPWRGHVYVFVACAYEGPYGFQRLGGLELGHVPLHLFRQAVGKGDYGLVLLRHGAGGGGDNAAEVLVYHAHRAGEQVAKVVCKVGIYAVNKRLVGEYAVAAEGHLPKQEVAYGVHAVAVAELDGIHHVALGLAHLAALKYQPAVAEYLLGQGLAQRHEHDRPDYGMEPDYLLAHQVDVRRPVFFIQAVVVRAVAQLCYVVGEGVQPYVYHVLLVKVHGYAPGEAGAGYAKVLKAGQQEVVQHLVGAGGGLNEVRVILYVLYKAGGVLAHLKEVALLLDLLHRPAAIRAAAVLELALQPEALAGGAVPALVGGLIYVTLLVQLAEYLLNGLYVVIVGGADKAVVGYAHELPEILEGSYYLVHVLLGGNALGLCLALYLLAVLVASGEEVHVVARHALIAGYGVRRHGGVAVAYVQLVAGVVYGGGDVEGLFLLLCHVSSP